MKRTLLILLVITFCLSSFSGCFRSDHKAQIDSISRIENDDPIVLTDMTEDAKNAILTVLDEGDWKTGVTNCGYGHDYELTATKGTIRYHSECGTFVDITNGETLMLSEEKKAEVNEALGVKKADDTSNRLEHSGYETTVKLMRYDWSGFGVSTKTISACDIAYYLIDALAEMPETGETVEKISDMTVEATSTDLPVERGTMWIEGGKTIYRIDPDLQQLCRVEGHLGKGYVLEMNEDFKSTLREAWYYYPYDFYAGTYQNSNDELEWENVFDSDSSVHVHINKIEIENNDAPNNKITVELLSTVDQTVWVYLNCERSDDNLADGDSEKVVLTKGVAQTVELSFGGWKDHYYWVYIRVDNTMIDLKIDP